MISAILSHYRAKLVAEGLSTEEIAKYLTLCARARVIEEMKGTIDGHDENNAGQN